MLRNKVIPEWVGRKEAVRQVWAELEDRSLLLVGPRRIGKTELLKYLAAHPAHGRRVLRVDVQSARTTMAGIERIRASLAGADLGPGLVEKATDRIASFDVAGVGAALRDPREQDPWNTLAGDLVQAVAALGEGERVVIALDEVPWWIGEVRKSEGDDMARTALAGLRFLRERDDLEAKVRWVLTGSVGLAGLARALEASADINDLHPEFTLGPLETAAGTTLFEMLLTSRHLGCTPEAARLAHQEAGGSPHWIHWLAGRAAGHAESTGTGRLVSEASVQRALADLEHPRMGRDLFDDEGRVHLLKHHGSAKAAILAEILNAAAASPAGLGEAQAQAVAQAAMRRPNRAQAREMVHVLVDAWYLDLNSDGSLRFVNPLFLRWWLRFGGQP